MKRLRLNYPLLFALVASCVAILCFQLVPAWDPYLGSSGYDGFARTLVAALVITVLYTASGGWLLDTGGVSDSTPALDPHALREEGAQTETAPQPPVFSVRNTAIAIIVAAVVLGVAKVLVQKSEITPPVPADLVFLAMLLGTAFFEEALFRGLLLEGFAKTLDAPRPSRSLLLAAMVSSILFGLLHVSTDLGSLFRATAYIEAAVKVLECALFGIALCAVCLKTRSIWPCVLIHFVFDAISELPIFLATGTMTSTYLTGSPADIAVLLVTCTLLLTPARWAFALLRG